MSTPIVELNLIVSETNSLSVQDFERSKLVETLRPIADSIEYYTEYAATVIVADEFSAKRAAETRDLILADAVTAESSLREFDHKLIDRLFKTHRAWTALIGRFSVLQDAAKKVKQAILRWQVEEQEKVELERRRLQAGADQKARIERERLTKEAEKAATPAEKQAIQMRAAVPAPIVQVAAPKTAVKAQRRWHATVVDASAFMAAAAKDKSLLGFVDIDETKLARSKSANAMLEIPGVAFEQRLV